MRIAGAEERDNLWERAVGALSPAQREARRKHRQEALVRAEIYADLLKHPGWELLCDEIREQMGLELGLVMHTYPAPSKEAPTGEMRQAQIDWTLGGVNMLKWVLRLPGRAVREAERLRGRVQGSGSRGQETATETTGGEADERS